MREKLHTLDGAKFLLALLVVFIHTSGRESMHIGEEGQCDVYQTVVDIVEHICTIAVPGFFMLSGYLLLYGVERYDSCVYIAKMRKRIDTLLIPYLVWNTLKLLTLLIQSVVSQRSLGAMADVMDSMGWWRAYWDGNSDLEAPALLATWFIRDLMVFTLISPLLSRINRLSAYTLPLVLFILHALGAWPSEHVCGVEGLAFFTLGMALAQKKLRPQFTQRVPVGSISSHIALALSVAAFVLSIGMMYVGDVMYESGWTMESLNEETSMALRKGAYVAINDLAIVLSLYSLIQAVDILHRRFSLALPESFTSATYFIYLCHSLLVHSAVCAAVAHIFSQDAELAAIVRYLLPPFVTVLLLVAVHRFLRSKCAPLLRLLT